jgi:hypothetical protein
MTTLTDSIGFRRQVRNAHAWLLLLAIVICEAGFNASAYGQALAPDDALSRLTAQDLTESLIALVNLSATPGIGGMRLNVDTGDAQPGLKYDKFKVWIPLGWRTANAKLKLYTEFNFALLDVNDEFFARNNAGQTVLLDADRNVYSIRVGGGVEYYPSPKWRLTPYLAFAFSRLTSATMVQGGRLDFGNLTPVEQVLLTDWETNASTIAVGLDVQYMQWFVEERYRLDLEGKYAYGYTDTFHESMRILETSGHTHNLILLARWTTITHLKAFGKPLAWNLFVSNTSFLGQDKDDLGFRYFFGFGGGLEWYVKQKFFKGLFHLNFVGIRLEGIVGDDVTGGSIGISLRN